MGPLHLSPVARYVCCAIVLTDARVELDDVSVCCKVSLGLVQGCDWH